MYSEELVICLKSQRQEISDPGLKLGIYDSQLDDSYSTPLKIFQHKTI